MAAADHVIRLLTRDRHGTHRPGREMADDGKPDELVVLGAELAGAWRTEAELRARHPELTSPLGVGYDQWARELDLLRFVDSPLDARIEQLLEGARAASGKDRAELRASLTMDDFYTLITFARRAAVRTLRTRDASDGTRGLTAIGLVALDRVDWRDVSWTLGVLRSCLAEIGATIHVIDVLGELAEDELMRFVEVHLDVHPQTTIADWGFRVVETRHGVGLAQAGLDGDHGTVLLEAALDLAEIVDRDDYLTDVIEVGALPPLVWFPTSSRSRVSQELDQASGGVHLAARARPGADPADRDQQFSLWLTNTADRSAASELASLATDNPDAFHACLALEHESTLLLLVARSVVMGTPALETDDRLQRFREPFLSVLIRRSAT